MYNLCCQAQVEDVPRVHPLRVEFKYTVSRGQGIITCNRDWWEGVWGEVICHKKVQRSFLNQSLDPPPPQSKMSGSASGIQPFFLHRPLVFCCNVQYLTLFSPGWFLSPPTLNLT